MLGRAIAMLGGLLALAACNPPAAVSVNVSHIGTDKGYLNSRLAHIGDLFLWDKKANTISPLDNVELTTQSSDDLFSKVEASYTSGIDLGIGVSKFVKAMIETQIKSQSHLSLANARVTSFKHTFDDLSTFVNTKISDGNISAGQIWNLDDAVLPNSSLRYLLIYRVVKADKTEIEYNNNTVVGGEVTVPNTIGGSIKVSINGLSSSDFEGNQITTLVSYYVIQAYIAKLPNGRQAYSFKIDSSAANLSLSPLLRKLN